jgi:transcription antitermination factor NusG
MVWTGHLSERPEPGVGADWYALYARHQHEKNVARLLASKGMEVFLPLYRTTRDWSDRKKELSLPLFPCYVFVRRAVEHRLLILRTPGVHSFVEFGGLPAPVPQEEIEGIRRAVARPEGVEPYPFLKCGEWARVISGPLEGLEGILVRKKNHCRLVLSVEMLEKSVAVEVEAKWVERMSRPLRAVEPRLTAAAVC